MGQSARRALRMSSFAPTVICNSWDHLGEIDSDVDADLTHGPNCRCSPALEGPGFEDESDNPGLADGICDMDVCGACNESKEVCE